MIITIKRRPEANVTKGTIYVDGKLVCYCLEDKDRGLTQDMPLSILKLKKIFGSTCIPYGKYEVAITYSNRFKRLLPLVMNVPAYEGIRIHTGNTEADTLGCILPCTFFDGESGKRSTEAFLKLYDLIEKGIKEGKVYLEIIKDESN